MLSLRSIFSRLNGSFTGEKMLRKLSMTGSALPNPSQPGPFPWPDTWVGGQVIDQNG